jgi:hypothetical protein
VELTITADVRELRLRVIFARRDAPARTSVYLRQRKDLTSSGNPAAAGHHLPLAQEDRAMGRFWTDPDWRIYRIMRRFNRSGGFGEETWPYDDAPPEIMKIIRGKISLNDHEVGLIVYFRDPGTWTLLTSDRLIGETNGSAINADFRTISEIRSDLVCKDMLDADGNVRNRPIETLTVKADCKSYIVSIEGPFKSAPHLGLWNAVLMAMSMG